MIKAYTYLLGWSEQNKFYYGVRYAKGCSPEDLWKTYFTSSKQVKEFAKQYSDPDIIQIRKEFVDIDKAILWENKVLKRMNVVQRDDFLNKTTNKTWNNSTIEKRTLLSNLAKKRIGSKNSFYGSKHSIKTKNKISQTKKNETPIVCEICGTSSSFGNYKRWHGDNCNKYVSSGTEKILIADGIRYSSLGEAANILGVSNSTITYRINSNNFDYQILKEIS